jgi:hypothetical protein
MGHMAVPAEIITRPTAFTCDMRGKTHTTPATHLVDAQVHIGVDDYEPLTWLVCSDLACHLAAAVHAEAIGIHVDTRPLTVTALGLEAGAA